MKAPTLPTAEETLQIAYGTIKANQSSEHKDVDPVLLHAIESHTAAYTAAVLGRVKELENELKLSEDTIKHQAERCLKLEAENARYRDTLTRLLEGNMCSHAGGELIQEALKQEGE